MSAVWSTKEAKGSSNTVLATAGYPSGRIQKNAQMRQLLIDRLTDEYGRKVSQNRRSRLRQFVEKTVRTHVMDDDATVGKDAVKACDLQVGAFAYDLAARPQTPPTDLTSMLATTATAKSEREKLKARELRRKRAEAIENIRSIGMSEPPSLARMRQELHIAAREAVHRIQKSQQQAAELRAAHRAAGLTDDVRSEEEGDEGRGQQRGHSAHPRPVPSHPDPEPSSRGPPASQQRAAKMSGALRQAEASAASAGGRMQDALDALRKECLNHESMVVQSGRIEHRINAERSKQGGGADLSDALHTAMRAAKAGEDKAYLRRMTAAAEAEAARLDALRARERLDLVRGMARGSDAAEARAAVRARALVLSRMEERMEEGMKGEPRAPAGRAGPLAAPSYALECDPIWPPSSSALASVEEIQRAIDREGDGVGHAQARANRVFPHSPPPTSRSLIEGHTRAAERARHESALWEATRANATVLREAAQARMAALQGGGHEASAGVRAPSMARPPPPPPRPSTIAMATQGDEAGAGGGVLHPPQQQTLIARRLSRLRAEEEEEGAPHGAERDAASGLLLLPSMEVGQWGRGRRYSRASGPTGRVVGLESKGIWEAMTFQGQLPDHVHMKQEGEQGEEEGGDTSVGLHYALPQQQPQEQSQPLSRVWGGRGWGETETEVDAPALHHGPLFAPSTRHDLLDDDDEEEEEGAGGRAERLMSQAEEALPALATGRGPAPPPVGGGRPPIVPPALKAAILDARLQRAKASLAGRPGAGHVPMPKAVAKANTRPPSATAGSRALVLQPKPMMKRVSRLALGTALTPAASRAYAAPVPTVVTIEAGRRRGGGAVLTGIATLLATHAAREKEAGRAAAQVHHARLAAAQGGAGSLLGGTGTSKPRGLTMVPNELHGPAISERPIKRRSVSIAQTRAGRRQATVSEAAQGEGQETRAE